MQWLNKKKDQDWLQYKDIVLYIIVIHVYFFKAHLKLTIMH